MRSLLAVLVIVLTGIMLPSFGTAASDTSVLPSDDARVIGKPREWREKRPNRSVAFITETKYSDGTTHKYITIADRKGNVTNTDIYSKDYNKDGRPDRIVAHSVHTIRDRDGAPIRDIHSISVKTKDYWQEYKYEKEPGFPPGAIIKEWDIDMRSGRRDKPDRVHREPPDRVYREPREPVHREPREPVHREPREPVHREPREPVHREPPVREPRERIR